LLLHQAFKGFTRDLGQQIPQHVVSDIAITEALARVGDQFSVALAADDAFSSAGVIFGVGRQLDVLDLVQVRHARSMAEHLADGDLGGASIVELKIG